ncbi:MAG: glucose 1-dehydrogenase [Acidobacteriota bacterium]
MSSRRVALVTGSAGGIGRAVVAALADAGCAVAGLDQVDAGRDAEDLALRGDVSEPDTVERAVERVGSALGPVEVLVNAAGIGGPFHRVDEVALDEWERLFAVNVRGPWLLCRRLLPEMAARRRGRVINIASVQGLRGAARSSTYVATKHALVGLTRALALEWGGHGITVNAICPGYVDTPMGLRPDVDPGAAQALARIPSGRQARPDEVAAAVAFLAGERAAYVNGAVLVVDGGLSAG